MEVTVRCRSCRKALPVQASQGTEAIRCGGCGCEIPLEFSAEVGADRTVDRCPVCGGGDFYVRKDFDPKTGLLVVIAGAIVSAGFYWWGLDLVAYGILAGAVLIDLVVARWLGEVTVCYRCHAEFRGRYPRTAGPFDLHTADDLEHEYARKISRGAGA